jgi:hypothetical protein
MKPGKFLFILSIVFITGIRVFAQRDSSMPVFNYKRDFKAILQKTQQKDSTFSYQKLLIRFLSRDSSISSAETLALLIGFTESPYYQPFEDMETEKEIFSLNEERKYTEALVKARDYLQTHPLSLCVLKEASFCYHMQKNEDSATYYMEQVDKIMNAMIYSGSGKKPETPIFSLGLADGESFLPNAGMKVLNRDTDWNRNNHFIEIIDAAQSLYEHTNYYFIIQHAKEKIDDGRVNDITDKKRWNAEKKKKVKKKQKAGWAEG